MTVRPDTRTRTELIEALEACRFEAKRGHDADPTAILHCIENAIGPERPPAPQQWWTPLAAIEAVRAIREFIDAAPAQLGGRLVQIGAVCDELIDKWPAGPRCEDCHRPYEDPGFADLVVPDEVFAMISTTKDENGLFCPSCLIARLERAGFLTPGEFKSGPIMNGTLDCATEAAEQLARLVRRRYGVEDAVIEAAIKDLEQAIARPSDTYHVLGAAREVVETFGVTDTDTGRCSASLVKLKRKLDAYDRRP